MQILESVVGFDVIQMVNCLATLQVPTEVPLHDEPMLQDVSLLRSAGMTWRENVDVPIALKASATPLRIGGSMFVVAFPAAKEGIS